MFDYSAGDVLTYEILDKKDRTEGTQTMEILEVKETGEGLAYEMRLSYADKKGKEMMSTESEMLCTDEGMRFDLNRMMSGMLSQAGTEMEMEIVGEPETIPNDLSVGKSLPDDEYQIVMKMSGGDLPAGMGEMKNDVLIKDRKVAAKESVNVPAGTFECYKVTYTQSISMNIMGMKRTTEYQGAYWINDGAGLVKSASYNKNGKYSGGMVLKSK